MVNASQGQFKFQTVSLAIGDMHRGSTTVDVTIYFRGNANEMPPKSSHDQSHDLCIRPLSKHIFALLLLTALSSRHEERECGGALT